MTPQYPIVVLDASVWVSQLVPTDINHAVARAWVRQHTSGGGTFVAPALFVTEVGAAMSRVTRQQHLAQRAVNDINTSPLIRLVALDQQLLDDATDMAVRLALRGADSIYVATARLAQLPLVSLDSEQLNKPAHLITTIKP